MKTERTGPGYALQSDLARLCLPAATCDPDRKFAWMNSICALFLMIGLFGRPAGIHIKQLPPLEEILPTIIEPVVAPPPTTIVELKPEQVGQQEKQEASQVVVVTPDSPDIHFSVPTIGTLLASAPLSAAPPLMPMRPPVPVVQPVARKQPVTLQNTGLGGERPQPPYPPLALAHGQQGTVLLLLTVDAVGGIQTIAVKQSSGFPLLDRSTQEFIKSRWTVPPGAGTRTFEATIRYRLEPN